jgi:two-component system phosphate regulon sensor histidine kinase PhoR
MISGMVLLLILQSFWLQSSYEKAFHDFRRETGFMFRNVVLGLRDSAIVKNIEPVKGDTLLPNLSSKIVLKEDRGFKKNDSTIHVSNFQVYVQSSDDSVKSDMLKSLVPRFRSMQVEGMAGAPRSFIVKLGPDTLNTDSISVEFGRALSKARINVPFLVKHMRTTPAEAYERLTAASPLFGYDRDMRSAQQNLLSDTIQSDFVRINPMNRYAVTLAKVRGILIQEILPQILFSSLLTLIITTAFILMYRSIRSQQKLMELKNDFISNITHELKTPVATVSVAIEALKNFKVLEKPELTREYLDIAQNELNRLTIMTDKILKTSVFEKGKMDFTTEKVHLDKTVDQILASLKLVFEKRNAYVTYEKEGNDFELEGSSIHLTNVVYNLIDNALKYSLKNPVVNILLKNSTDKLTLSVKDSGIGIPSEYQKKIFEKFFRVPTGDVHNAKGYGLGLSYVAAVIKSHKGTISVESQPGEGSHFTILLPKKLVS